GTTGSSGVRLSPSRSRMIEPLPYSFSMLATASSMAFARFLSSMGLSLSRSLAVQSVGGDFRALSEFILLLRSGSNPMIAKNRPLPGPGLVRRGGSRKRRMRWAALFGFPGALGCDKGAIPRGERREPPPEGPARVTAQLAIDAASEPVDPPAQAGD